MSDPHVFHFELVHDGKPVERLQTLCLEPEQYARLGAPRVSVAVETQRRDWQRRIVSLYGAGWSVQVRRERGYLRSQWPGAALRPSPAVEGAAGVSGLVVTK